MKDYMEEVKMIFAIATTTLNKEVKRKLKTGQYSRRRSYIHLFGIFKVKEAERVV